jgi:hypothetical protein
MPTSTMSMFNVAIEQNQTYSKKQIVQNLEKNDKLVIQLHSAFTLVYKANTK